MYTHYLNMKNKIYSARHFSCWTLAPFNSLRYHVKSETLTVYYLEPASVTCRSSNNSPRGLPILVPVLSLGRVEEQGDLWFTKLPEVLVCCRGLLDRSAGKQLCVWRVDACLCVRECIVVFSFVCLFVCYLMVCVLVSVWVFSLVESDTCFPSPMLQGMSCTWDAGKVVERDRQCCCCRICCPCV